MISAVEATVIAVMLFIGSTVLSTVGFGIGMSTTPVLLLVFDPQTVVVVVNTISILLFGLIIYQNRADIPVRTVIPWSLAGLVGVPVGVFVLSSASASLLRIGITVLIIVLTVITALNLQNVIPRWRWFGFLVAAVVSALLNSLGIGGPLMALYILSQGWSRNAIRGSLAFYFVVVEASGVVGYGVTGLLTQERIVLILITVIPVILGFWLATFLVKRMNEDVFRRAVVVVIVGTSLMVLAREVSGL
ncbi:MAG: sulfite exporter TauE/SafE family protein [SAR202 cluster bacterium]|nr:sulfite exporter TauE/SafE family protein [SAR202 cluster bacterium]MDP6716651.1 sulfite exporter TauE/SafE family protein [SAR202 cluster bacterium]